MNTAKDAVTVTVATFLLDSSHCLYILCLFVVGLTGLDPAGLYFTTVSSDFRLDESDASYVDVIHTDAGVLGTNRRDGDVDFYPNGGSRQPGCLFKCKLKRSKSSYPYSFCISFFLLSPVNYFILPYFS